MVRRIGVFMMLLALWIIPSRPTSAQVTGDFYAEAFLSNPSPYLGEQVVYTLRYYAYDISRIPEINPVHLPDFQRFWVGDIFNLRPVIETINGIQYNVGELVVELIPLHSGQVTIQPAQLIINETPFLAGGVFATTPLEVDVRPLPPDAPVSFNGAVGQYAMRAELDRLRAEVGQPIRLTMDIQGTGAFALLPPPQLDLGEAWRVIVGEPQTPNQPDRTLINLPLGRRVFEWLLIPLQSGSLSLNNIRFSYFDPTREIYVKGDEWQFTVEVFAAQETIRDFNSGLITAPQLPLKPIVMTSPSADNETYPSWAWWVIPPLSAAIVGGVRLYRWQRTIIRQHRRKKFALQRAIQRLTELSQLPPERIARRTQNILRAYVGDKLGIESPLVGEIAALLETQGLGDVIISRTEKSLLQAQSLSYMPNASRDDAAHVIEQLRQTLINLEREWRKQ